MQTVWWIWIYHPIFHAILVTKDLECGLLYLTQIISLNSLGKNYSHIFFSLKKMEKREMEARVFVFVKNYKIKENIYLLYLGFRV